MVNLSDDLFAINGYKVQALMSVDTLEYLKKMNERTLPDEMVWFKELTAIRYDPETGEEFDV